MEAKQAQMESLGWRPEDGETVAGRVVAVSRSWSDWTNAYYPLVTIEAPDGKRTEVHAFHQTLQARLMEVRPTVGERLEITYLGKTRTKDDKREVAVYRVNAPDATGTEVWDSLEAQPRQAAQAAAQGKPHGDDDIPF